MEAQVDDSYLEHIGQIVEHGSQDVLERIPDIAKKLEGQYLCLGEDREQQRYRYEQLYDNQQPFQYVEDGDDDAPLPMNVKKLVVLFDL